MADYPKYIIVDVGGNEQVFVGPSISSHAELRPSGTAKVVAAGFFRFDVDKDNPDRVNVVAFGKSDSLNIDSRQKEDEYFLEQYFRVGRFHYSVY